MKFGSKATENIECLLDLIWDLMNLYLFGGVLRFSICLSHDRYIVLI